MEVIITNASNIPIYEQIYLQIKTKILKNELQEGDALPSMRLLAKELRISVITTKRAYEELERDGYILTVVGKGSFVAAKNTALVREEHLKDIERLLEEAAALSHLCGLSWQELQELMKLLYEED